jgi:hypothetical protein
VHLLGFFNLIFRSDTLIRIFRYSHSAYVLLHHLKHSSSKFSYVPNNCTLSKLQFALQSSLPITLKAFRVKLLVPNSNHRSLPITLKALGVKLFLPDRNNGPRQLLPTPCTFGLAISATPLSCEFPSLLLQKCAGELLLALTTDKTLRMKRLLLPLVFDAYDRFTVRNLFGAAGAVDLGRTMEVFWGFFWGNFLGIFLGIFFLR